MRLLAAALLALCAAPARAADAAQAQRDAYGAFLQGRYDDAAAGWRYVSELGVSGPRPEANAALTERDAARPEASLPLWIKAALADDDGFEWNQRGWAALSLGRVREAREAFSKGIDRAAAPATQAEANLGLGLAALSDGSPKSALEPLRRAASSGPGALAAADLLYGQTALKIGDKPAALTYLRQTLELDPFNREAQRGLVFLLDKIGDNRAAWLAARRTLSLDPGDAAVRKVMDRNVKFVVGDSDDASGVRRLARPLLNPDDADRPIPVSSRTISVGLFGAPDGRPGVLTRCYVMVNSAFKVTSAAFGTMRDNGPAFDQWGLEYRPETGLVEVRDSARNILFVSKQPFTLIPSTKRGSILIKSVKIADTVGVDIGDREVRGSVSVHPTPWGFRLVEEVPLEAYLYGVVSLALPEGSPPDAYRAQAVVARTAAAWAITHRPQTPEGFDLLDDRSVQTTIGLSGELRVGADAVGATEGLVLADRGAVAYAPQHDDSGGRTEDGRESGEPGVEALVSVADAAKPLPEWTSALEFERFIHEPPPEGLYSAAASGPVASSARWVRVLDAADIRPRADKRKEIGRLRSIRVAGRTAAGRVKALDVTGARGSVTVTGFKEIQELLSPGSLRSALFTLQPLYDGKDLDRVLVWGAGTGDGLGFSRAGALGQAALGRPWREILKSYFPNYELRDLNRALPRRAAADAGTPAGPPKDAVGPYKRTLNYRLKKK